MTMPPAPTLTDIQAAACRLAGHAVRTPLLESSLLNERAGRRVLVKAEPLQRTGSFKFRGAYNRLSLIDPATRARGVVAYSSGNHAQGVAAAAQLMGVPAVIVMPTDAPALKLANTRAYGAEVILYDRVREDREAIGAALSRERGLTLIKPYDDHGLMAGQGTVGLEIAEQAAERGIALDAAVVCCGGGGLVAGTATALTALVPSIAVFSAEPAGFDDTARSLAAGERLGNPALTGSICDALLAPMPGELTFAINRRLLKGGLAVTDQEALQAMRAAFDTLKLVAEPGGAVALAAVLAGRLPPSFRTVAVVVSGGNVDPALFSQALAA